MNRLCRPLLVSLLSLALPASTFAHSSGARAKSSAHKGKPVAAHSSAKTGVERSALAPVVPDKITDKQRQKIAIRTVTQTVKPWVPKDQTMQVRTSIVGFAGNPSNPITGNDVVRVWVRQDLKPNASLIQRVEHIFSKYSNREFDVFVGPDGKAKVLAMESKAPQYKFFRAVNQRLPVPELINEMVHSPKIEETLVTAAFGGAALALSPPVAAMAFARTVQLVTQGVSAQRKARDEAFQGTVSWAKNTKQVVNLMQAYNYYTDRLQHEKDSASALSMYDFAEKLSVAGL